MFASGEGIWGGGGRRWRGRQVGDQHDFHSSRLTRSGDVAGLHEHTCYYEDAGGFFLGFTFKPEQSNLQSAVRRSRVTDVMRFVAFSNCFEIVTNGRFFLG